MAQTVTMAQKLQDTVNTHVWGTIAIGAGNYAAGGLAVDFDVVIGADVTPFYVNFINNTGYVCVWVQATQKMLVFQGDYDPAAVGPLVELLDAAIPAGVVSSVTTFYAIARTLNGTV